MSPEEKIAAEAKRNAALAAAEARRRWALAQEKEGTHSRESKRWLSHREAKDQEAESTDAVAAAFADAERATLKAIRKNHKSSLRRRPRMARRRSARSILAAVGDAERRATDALERVHTCVMAEIFAAQENGFMSEEERHRLDARARRSCALLDSLLRDFQRKSPPRATRRTFRGTTRAPPRGTARPRACSRTSCTSSRRRRASDASRATNATRRRAATPTRASR